MSILGKRLESERERAGWTKTRAAKQLKMPLATYANYEYGNREPDGNTLTLLAKLFDTTTDYLLGKTDNRDSKNDSPAPSRPTTFEDLGLPYKGNVPDDVNDMYRAIAKQYAEKHNLPKRDV